MISKLYNKLLGEVPVTMKLLPIPIFTMLGICILASGVCIPIASVIFDANVEVTLVCTAMFIWVFLLVLAYDYYRACVILRKIRVTVVPPSLAYSNVHSVILIKHEKLDGVTNGCILCRPEIPEGIIVDKEIYVVPIRRISNLSISESSVSHSVEYGFIPLRRGNITWNRIFGRITLSHGIATWQVVFNLQPVVSINVQPNPCLQNNEILSSNEQRIGGDTPLTLINGVSGREFHSLRKYSVGDDMRHIDWKRSARGRGIFVKQYQPETHQRISIALDCGRRMGNVVENRLKIEYATDAASHLMHLARCSQDEVGLFAFDIRVAASINCQRGIRHNNRIMEALTNIQVSPVESDYQLLTEWAAANRRRSLLLLITSVSNPNGLDHIRKALLPIRNKHLPLVFALADRDLQALVMNRVNSIDEAYVVSAAREQLIEIKNRVAILEKSGIPCVYCDVSNLTETVHSKYHKLKYYGKL